MSSVLYWDEWMCLRDTTENLATLSSLLQRGLVLLEARDGALHVGLALLGLQRLPDAERDARLVEGLVGVQRHPQLIPGDRSGEGVIQ